MDVREVTEVRERGREVVRRLESEVVRRLHRFYNSNIEVNLRQQSKVLYVGIEDIKSNKLSGSLWSFPYLIDVIARLVVVKRGFTCFTSDIKVGLKV